MRLLLIEDNDRLAELLNSLLSTAGFAVDRVADIATATEALDSASYEIILLDLRLPDGDGMNILRALRTRKNYALVLVTTAKSDVVDRVQTLNAGADDYLVKPFSPDELLARIHALLRRRGELTPDVLTLANVSLDTVSLTLLVDDKPVKLPRREICVLTELLRRQGRVLRREALEEAIYPFDAEVTPNAIEASISRLRRRLEAADALVSITALRGIGYLLSERIGC